MRLASIIDAPLLRTASLGVPSVCVLISPGVSARYQWLMPNDLMRTLLDQLLRYCAANACSKSYLKRLTPSPQYSAPNDGELGNCCLTPTSQPSPLQPRMSPLAGLGVRSACARVFTGSQTRDSALRLCANEVSVEPLSA